MVDVTKRLSTAGTCNEAMRKQFCHRLLSFQMDEQRDALVSSTNRTVNSLMFLMNLSRHIECSIDA